MGLGEEKACFLQQHLDCSSGTVSFQLCKTRIVAVAHVGLNSDVGTRKVVTRWILRGQYYYISQHFLYAIP